jgi:transposase-like protein
MRNEPTHRILSRFRTRGIVLWDRASYRDVEDLLAERGLDVSHETVRTWVR